MFITSKEEFVGVNLLFITPVRWGCSGRFTFSGRLSSRRPSGGGVRREHWRALLALYRESAGLSAQMLPHIVAWQPSGSRRPRANVKAFDATLLLTKQTDVFIIVRNNDERFGL